MEPPGDQRQCPRVNLPGSLCGSMAFSDTIRIVNISSIGAMIEHADRLSPGQPCVLDLRLGAAELQVRAGVVWCAIYSVTNDREAESEVRYRSGLHFADLPESSRDQIQRYLVTLGMRNGAATR